MATYRKTGRRCDACGKFSMAPMGEYRRADGSAGYINSEESDNGRDFCSDCRDQGRDQQPAHADQITVDGDCPTAREIGAALRDLTWFDSRGDRPYGDTIRALVAAGF